MLLTILLWPFLFSGKAQAVGLVVLVTEFSDFHCPHCQQAAVVVEQPRQIYGDDVEFVPQTDSFHRTPKPNPIKS